MPHKNGSATPVTHNDRAWPAAGPVICGAGDDGGFAIDRALVRAWGLRYPAYRDSEVEWVGGIVAVIVKVLGGGGDVRTSTRLTPWFFRPRKELSSSAAPGDRYHSS